MRQLAYRNCPLILLKTFVQGLLFTAVLLIVTAVPLPAIAEPANTTETDLISTAHWVLHTEWTLDRPLSEVWPVFKDMFRWYTEYTVDHVSGPSYQAGSGLAEDQVLKLTRASNFDDAAGSQHFVIYQKTINVVPQKEIVIVLSGPVSGWKQYVWKMKAKAKTTTIFIDAYGEAELVKPLSKGELTEYHEKLTRDWHRSWSKALLNLKQITHADID